MNNEKLSLPMIGDGTLVSKRPGDDSSNSCDSLSIGRSESLDSLSTELLSSGRESFAESSDVPTPGKGKTNLKTLADEVIVRQCSTEDAREAWKKKLSEFQSTDEKEEANTMTFYPNGK